MNANVGRSLLRQKQAETVGRTLVRQPIGRALARQR